MCSSNKEIQTKKKNRRGPGGVYTFSQLTSAAVNIMYSFSHQSTMSLVPSSVAALMTGFLAAHVL